jgi:hypothetical protein
VISLGNLYLGNKMTGLPYFNAPWFDKTAIHMRSLPGVTAVFNPADEDRRSGFDPMLCPHGTLEEAEANGFDLRRALGADWFWISTYSNGQVVGPNWENSVGTISEVACHQALGLPVWEEHRFFSRIDKGRDKDLLNSEWQLPLLKRRLALR